MGEVYLAQDTTLDRLIAIKVLPASFSADASRRARFIREAKAVASLNHPNIVTLHSVEESNEVLFLTMELVHGKTLAELLPAKGFSLDKFFAIAIPLVGALAAAHQRGIAHRDLKPGNIMITDDGRVKVLDFGIAKAFVDDVADAGRETNTVTQAGHVVGTPAYMAPEQAEGKATDARSDIFAAGVVLFEMLAGLRPFGEGGSPRRQPEKGSSLKDVRPDVPRELVRLIQRCLAIDPDDRYQSAVDVRHGLEEIKQDLESGELVSVVPRAAPPRWRRTALALLAATVTIAAGASLWTRSESAPRATIPRLRTAVQVTASLDVESYPSWSPDSGRVAYMGSDGGYYFIGNHDIWVAQLGRGEPVNLTKHPANDRMPSWSPDGREIAFFSDRGGAWAVYTMPAIGGSPRNVLPLPALPAQPRSWSAPQWSRDGKQLFVSAPIAEQNVVLVLSLESLDTTRVELPKHEGSFCWDLAVSPDARQFAYVEALGLTSDVTRLWTVAVAGGEPVALTDGRTNVWSPKWSNDGRAVYYVSNRGGSMDLWQQDIGADGRPMGDAVAITQGLGIRSAAFSPDGTKLAYGRGGRVTNVWRAVIPAGRPITWDDAEQLTSERAFIEFVDISPNGTWLALSSDRRGNPDLWLLPSDGGEMTPLTTDPTPDWNPRWSRDGSQIVFYAYRTGNRDIWVMPAAGGPARQLSAHPGHDRYPSWSPDGSAIAYWAAGLRQTMIVAAAGGEPRALRGVGDGIGEWSPTADALVHNRQGKLYWVSTIGGEAVPLPDPPARPAAIRFFSDAKSILFSVVDGAPEDREIWRMLLADGTASRLTQLRGRRGDLNENFATDGKYLYFIWREDDGDIWVMDVER